MAHGLVFQDGGMSVTADTNVLCSSVVKFCGAGTLNAHLTHAISFRRAHLCISISPQPTQRRLCVSRCKGDGSPR